MISHAKIDPNASNVNSFGGSAREHKTGSFPKGNVIITTGCQNPSAFSFVGSQMHSFEDKMRRSTSKGYNAASQSLLEAVEKSKVTQDSFKNVLVHKNESSLDEDSATNGVVSRLLSARKGTQSVLNEAS